MSGVITEHQGVFKVYYVSETAQVELGSGRVQAPAASAKNVVVRSSLTNTRSSGPTIRGLHPFTFQLNLSCF